MSNFADYINSDFSNTELQEYNINNLRDIIMWLNRNVCTRIIKMTSLDDFVGSIGEWTVAVSQEGVTVLYRTQIERRSDFPNKCIFFSKDLTKQEVLDTINTIPPLFISSISVALAYNWHVLKSKCKDIINDDAKFSSAIKLFTVGIDINK